MDARDWDRDETAQHLRVPTGSDDKYSRGVVGLRTGSTAYPGAAVLGVEAAWRTGVGMVRYLGPDRPTALVLQRRPETVTADGRVQAWVIGSGIDQEKRTDADTAALREVLDGDVPVVADAGALDLVRTATAPLLVTPHAGEHDRLRELLGLDRADRSGVDARAASAAETAAALGATVLLKGSTTIVADAAGRTIRVTAATPWLATAGTGDVLAGTIGALVAAAGPSTAGDLAALAASGAWLHGRAAARAASALGRQGGPITALDVAAALPAVVAETLAAR
ncbi:ADP-dependent NAD(P)H-hydrate dehydratase [Microbacterium terricola]|uniref:ADP-dependent (S)-NAD(P)H-hydrate dehydratase n=1 Tax=Microbacterium terricola TaxID=344163 RepID=A0ABM8DWW4_9MICO|nr:ADP/ATP-dependent (S)-NAD(P)H-hydrate dehydratase [Microbacterium terricola]UYK39180.1 NAD(P)H-hydrate dehydratase [Microbacterium terricola]BDV30101.1 hypothetical protein Microterr_07610 [Microbacterium terricola]